MELMIFERLRRENRSAAQKDIFRNPEKVQQDGRISLVSRPQV